MFGGVAGTVLEPRWGKQSNAIPGLAWSHKLWPRIGVKRDCLLHRAILELFPQKLGPTSSSTCPRRATSSRSWPLSEPGSTDGQAREERSRAQSGPTSQQSNRDRAERRPRGIKEERQAPSMCGGSQVPWKKAGLVHRQLGVITTTVLSGPAAGVGRENRG